MIGQHWVICNDDSALILRRLHQLFAEELDWLYPDVRATEIREVEDQLSVDLGALVRQLAYAIAVLAPYLTTQYFLIWFF